MIEFKQAPTGTPPDILVTTDDGEAELATMNDAFLAAGVTEDDFVAFRNLNGTKVEGGEASFVIPGDEAADVGDIFEEGDMPTLNEYLEDQNSKAMARAEAQAEGQGAE